MYIGPTTLDAPTATPPIKRKKIKIHQFVANAQPRAENRYKYAMAFRLASLPNFSAGLPQKRAPAIVPKRATAIVNPCSQPES